MKDKKSGILMCGGLLLIAAAFCMTSYNLWDAHRAAVSAHEIVRQMDMYGPVSETGASSQQESEEIIPAYLLDPTMEMPTIQVDGHDYIGTIEIPALELSLPVMSQWSYSNLKLSPCRFEGSAYLDDLIIAAHNYRSHFGGLKNLAVGDDVVFTDVEGNVFRYKAAELETVDGNDLEALESGDWDLTLFTCTLARTTRVVVRCELE